jgi:hypothetical protein
MNENESTTSYAALNSQQLQHQQHSIINSINYQPQSIQPPQAHQINQNNSSTSPLSNSSTNSSSCIAATSFSTSTPFPAQLQYHKAINQNFLMSPSNQNQYLHHQLTDQQLNNLGALTNNSSTSIENNQVIDNNQGKTASVAANSCSFVPQNSFVSVASRPEAKKVKTHKTQPSKVVHIRNIPPQLTEVEVIQFGLIFGNIVNVLNLRSKCQAFLEFEKCEEAQSMVNYFVNNPITAAGRQIFAQYSNYKNLITDPNNTNNQVAKAALDLTRELHKAAQTGGTQTVLRAMIQNMLYPVTLDVIYQLFSKYGHVLKIITFTKNGNSYILVLLRFKS